VNRTRCHFKVMDDGVRPDVQNNSVYVHLNLSVWSVTQVVHCFKIHRKIKSQNLHTAVMDIRN
jgi:hypothetical protein